MQKVADAADISVLFFSAGANFWAILDHFWAFLGNFRSFLGHFLVLFFVAKYASVLFKSLFATLSPPPSAQLRTLFQPAGFYGISKLACIDDGVPAG